MAQDRDKRTERGAHEAESRERKRGGPQETAGKPERTTPEKDIPPGPPGKSPSTPDPPREFDL